MDCYREMAEVYDRLIHKDIDYKGWSEFILNKCNKYKVSKEDYIDLACGTGNFTVEIGKNFRHIWAVDLSSEMLSKAEDKVRKKGIKAKFVCQDICDVQTNRKFDLVTCCLDSTNYILDYKELGNYFKSVYNMLKDDGIFIFDINSYYKLTEILGNNIYNYDDEDVVYIWENYLENNILDMYLTFFIRNGQVYERFDESHSERAYKEEEIERELQNQGLKILEKLDNYEEEKVKSHTERIVYIVKKA